MANLVSYIKKIWKDAPSTDTPINAENLNHIEDGIYNNATAINTLNSDLESLGTYTVVGSSGSNVSERLTSLATLINSLTEKQRFNSKLQIGSAVCSFTDITGLTYSATIISKLGALDIISASVNYSKVSAINIATAGTITFTDWTNLDLPVNLRY